MALNLLSVYDEMIKQAAAQPEVTNEPEGELTEEQILNKYAEAAVEYLVETVGENKFTQDDVVKTASAMIESDQELIKQAEAQEEVEVNEAMQKVAEAHELGTIMAQSFLTTLAQTQE